MALHIRPPIRSFNKTSPPELRFLDPVAAWRALPPRAQEEIGSAAIAASVASYGATTLADAGRMDEARPYETAAQESLEWLDALVGISVLGDRAELPPVPDLRPFGIQQCTGCGCTDNHACEAGCRWAAQDLCSECAGPA